jgi:hypothetical protein
MSEDYTTLARYTIHERRVYHASDTTFTGPSISLAEYYIGKRPAPRRPRPTSPPPEPPPLKAATRVYVNASHAALACETCGKVSGCACGHGTADDVGARITAMQKTRIGR